MAEVTATVEVGVPVSIAYNQWTQFEEFPEFMEGVEEVRQLDDATLEWRANIGGVERSWEARITEQEPDQVIAWQSVQGTDNSGRVEFEALDARHTRIDLTIFHEPEGAVETIGQALGIVERRAEGDLERDLVVAGVEVRRHHGAAVTDGLGEPPLDQVRSGSLLRLASQVRSLRAPLGG